MCFARPRGTVHENYVIADVNAVFVNMGFSDKDTILLKKLYHLKAYKATELNKWWTKRSINRLLKT